ncbi:MAG: tyrosine-type recombinase/integrase [Methyloceanibacter sp.]|uniref:tyrosine-type recombinase/integrase n=1 Tax=Methyloceanibacter sp. TaxID=1965321 RepID=UPI003D9B424C
MKHALLTNAKVRDVSKRGLYLDGAGLYLQVSAFDTKSWIFRFTINRRVRDMGLGPYPPITLAQARKLAAEQREHLIRGDDPLDLRQSKKDKIRSDELENILFRDAAKRFLGLYADTWKNDKHKKQWASTLEQYALKSLGSRRAVSIDGKLITDALAHIWTTKQETASRVKQRIERVVQWVKDGMPLPQHGASKRVTHHPALQYEQAPAFVAALRQYDSISARALELTILTAARTSDTIEAKWKEVDFERAVWTVSDGRHKTSKTFEIPLSQGALDLLAAMPRIKGNAYIFPGNGGKGDAPISNAAMAELLKGIHAARAKAGLPPWLDKESGRLAVVHGFRSTFRDWAGDRSNFPREVIEAAMSHQIKDKAEAAYRRTTALEKRRKLMEEWSGFCGKPFIEEAIAPRRAQA